MSDGDLRLFGIALAVGAGLAGGIVIGAYLMSTAVCSGVTNVPRAYYHEASKTCRVDRQSTETLTVRVYEVTP